MRLYMFSECPWVPSSAGKISMLLAVGLARRGYDVKVFCAGGFATLYGPVVYNPRRWCRGDYCGVLPDVDVEVYPFPSPDWVVDAAHKIGRPDAALSYATPYVDPGVRFNEAITKLGVPAAAYVISEVAVLGPSAAASIGAYNAVAAPTRWCLDTFLAGMARLAGEKLFSEEERFTVVPHGLHIELYKRLGGSVEPAVENKRFRIGIFAKNHVRKDALSVALAVARLVASGVDAELHLFLVDAVSEPVWDVSTLNDAVWAETGVNLLAENRIVTLDATDSALGLSEEGVVKLYKSMDVLAFMTRGEAFGLPPLEAALVDTPFIVSAHPAVAEVWGPNTDYVECQWQRLPGAATLCQPNDNQLAEKLEAYARGWLSLRSLLEKEKQKAEEYTWNRMINGIEQLLEKAMNEKENIARALDLQL